MRIANKIGFVFAAVLLGLLPACAPRVIDHEQVSKNEKIVIRFSHVVGEDTPKGQAARMFAKLMKERTNGKVEVQVFSNSSLYKDSEETDALQQNRIQIIAPATPKLSSLVPELAAFDLPYLYSDLDRYHQVLDGPVGQQIAASLYQQNMVELAYWDGGMKQFTNSVRPIRTPEDLAGMTMRIMPSAVLDQQFKLLQVTPVEINFNDLYSALTKKQVDGQENSISNIYSKRFFQVQKYLTLSDHGLLGYVVVMNRDFWNSLDPETRRTISLVMQEVTDWERQQAVQFEQNNLKAMSNCQCIEIDRLSQAEKDRWKEFYQPLYQTMEQKLGTHFFRQLNPQP
ncbi:DctP family TRAP transporter solute-binding subunit [Effusibacillus dendaii]|uniref:C4-dicarboxylate ABC transporter n=1 Tax=Effusibacillus dendaii TaxID=2743772 RepID=A0A7I8D8C8_9BACL|nr:DctP family TRAP transporter solute-binding subunit [Effusibacillus dendaii]BCJ86403.1 C4-dicarboxylate ABC transporter [Effusibacillus dendaii]